MLINAADPEEARIAVVEDGVLQELQVEIANREAYLGNIYKGRVVNVEPSIGAAFVAFGGRSNGFLHASDVLPAYADPDFELEGVIQGRARITGDEGPDSVRAALADSEDSDDEDDGDESEDVRSEAEDATSDDDDDAAEDSGHEATEDDEDHSFDQDADLDSDHLDSDDDSFGAEAMDRRAGVDFDDEDESDDDTAVEDGSDDEPDDDSEEEEEESAASETRRPRRRRRRSSRGEGDSDGSEPQAASDGESEPAAAPQAKTTKSRRSGGDRKGADRKSGAKNGRNRRKGAPRSRVPIEQLVRKGQELIVQVTKEGIGAKGPSLTTFVSLPGRSLVLMPSLPKCGVSRKIEDAKERRRLKRIVKDLDETGNGGVGFIVRTNGVAKSKDDLQRDRDYLKRIWELIGDRVSRTRAPSLLYQESDLVLKAMRDLFSPEIDEVVVDSRDVYLRIQDFAEKLMPHLKDRIKLHELHTPLFHSFGIEQEVEQLYQPRVELKNGGSIVIEQAEALVAIDVNSGRFKPGSDLEETAYQTNRSAVPEICRQLKLRDLGGLVMIDFIDMNSEKHRRAIERKVIDGLRGDRARIKIGRISPFGMLELTRQRVGPGLKHTVFSTCKHCNGSGLVRTVQSKSLAVLREVRAVLHLKGFSVLQVFVAPPVNDFLANHKRRAVLELEEATGKSIVFRAEPSYPVEAVHYRFLTGDGQEARVAIPAGLGVKA
ncbi:MAG: Rne/Rng family ribonuclease [Planctomycetota bacterium]